MPTITVYLVDDANLPLVLLLVGLCRQKMNQVAISHSITNGPGFMRNILLPAERKD